MHFSDLGLPMHEGSEAPTSCDQDLRGSYSRQGLFLSNSLVSQVLTVPESDDLGPEPEITCVEIADLHEVDRSRPGPSERNL